MLVGPAPRNVVPILFSAAGNQRDMPANLAIASVTTVGYAGILAGPALIGFIAQFSSLTVAFACVAAPAVGGNRQRQGRHFADSGMRSHYAK